MEQNEINFDFVFGDFMYVWVCREEAGERKKKKMNKCFFLNVQESF